MSKKLMYQVSARALIQRINRKLKADGRMLKTLRGDRYVHDLGRYYVIDLDRNFILWKHIDLEEQARELGVLSAWERIETEAEAEGGA